jgi:hypothetical protein
MSKGDNKINNGIHGRNVHAITFPTLQLTLQSCKGVLIAWLTRIFACLHVLLVNRTSPVNREWLAFQNKVDQPRPNSFRRAMSCAFYLLLTCLNRIICTNHNSITTVLSWKASSTCIYFMFNVSFDVEMFCCCSSLLCLCSIIITT